MSELRDLKCCRPLKAGLRVSLLVILSGRRSTDEKVKEDVIAQLQLRVVWKYCQLGKVFLLLDWERTRYLSIRLVDTEARLRRSRRYFSATATLGD